MRGTHRLIAFTLFALVTVEVGGWSLLGLLTSEDRLTPFQEQFFRAGHAHAGVLLILALVYLILLERTDWRSGTRLGLSLISGMVTASLAVLKEFERVSERVR